MYMKYKRSIKSMADKRDTTLNLSEGNYLNYLKESMPGRQHKPIVEAEPAVPEVDDEEKEDEEKEED